MEFEWTEGEPVYGRTMAASPGHHHGAIFSFPPSTVIWINFYSSQVPPGGLEGVKVPPVGLGGFCQKRMWWPRCCASHWTVFDECDDLVLLIYDFFFRRWVARRLALTVRQSSAGRAASQVHRTAAAWISRTSNNRPNAPTTALCFRIQTIAIRSRSKIRASIWLR